MTLKGLLFFLGCIGGSVIQSVSGFGFAIFCMTFFPLLLGSYNTAVAVSGLCAATMAAFVAIRHRSHINIRLILPLLAAAARMRGRRPLYTAYSLQALASNDRFSHDKATAELGYHPRDLCLTVQDTVRWLQCHGVQPCSATRVRRRAKGASRRAVSADQG